MVDHSAVVSFIRGWTFQYEMEQQLTEEMQLFTQYMVDIKKYVSHVTNHFLKKFL